MNLPSHSVGTREYEHTFLWRLVIVSRELFVVKVSLCDTHIFHEAEAFCGVAGYVDKALDVDCDGNAMKILCEESPPIVDRLLAYPINREMPIDTVRYFSTFLANLI